MSFDGLKNNFIFIATNTFPFPANTNFFQIRNDVQNPDDTTVAQVYTPYFFGNDAADILWVGHYDTFDPTRWILTAAPPGNGGGGVDVPEPASITLIGIGITGLAGYGWRRRKLAV